VQAEIATAPVLLPLPFDGPFDYRVPDGFELTPGAYVEVPFGPREIVGVVWHTGPADRVPVKRLKPIRRRLDAPPMPKALRRLVERVAEATLAPLGNALKLAIAVPSALDPPAPRQGLLPSEASDPGTRLTPARRRVLAALADGVPRPAAEIARRAGVSSSVVQAMIPTGLLRPALLVEADAPAPDPEAGAVPLSPAQSEAAAALRALVGHGHGVTLLEGVPGAGKTEVYLEAVAEALRQGCQVLVLLPEIALSTQILDRFARRFGVPPAVWHSELGNAARRRSWRRIAEDGERIVIGARSALFLPFTNLGLIVVDEEHDSSFKQEDGVTYHARDMAIERGRLEDCPVMLVSATPALDTAWSAGRIAGAVKRSGPLARPLLLPARHGDAELPAVSLIDLKRDRPPAGGWLAPALRRTLGETLAAGEQVLLFLNRRGFAPLTLCRACGHRLRCPNCASWLVSHRLRRRMMCHHCGYSRAEPEHCPACGSLEALAPCGPGVERLAEEVRGLWPAARVAIVTSDRPAGPAEAAELVRAMHDHSIDVLIGTQIIAKGHHFPDLTLVGVVDGDLGLSGGDLRAAERSFQLLYQVAGRAGRTGRRGIVLIQTHLPDHPVMQALAAGDKERFYAEELLQREEAGMPPFGRLAALIVAGPDLQAVRRFAAALAKDAPERPGLRVLGPAPAPLALLRGRYRQRLLVIAGAGLDLPAALRPWLQAHKPKGGIRLQVDIDPYGFL
jgi:primosomal protein N' (replication factor Y) (superfamily II helicase)